MSKKGLYMLHVSVWNMSTLNDINFVFYLFWPCCWPSCITALFIWNSSSAMLSLVYRTAVSQTKQTLLTVCFRPTRVLNWCNDGEREQFPSLPTSWWLCSEGPGGRQFIMCPSPWPCHWRNRQAHVCMNYQPSHLRSPPSLTVESWHGGARTWGFRVLKCIFSLSIKT